MREMMNGVVCGWVRGCLGIGLAVVWVMGLVGCGGGSGGGGEGGGVEGKPRVVVTTTMVADLVAEVAGDAVELVRLMGPGVDPHLFKLPARSVAAIQEADAVVYSGLYLEGRLVDVFGELEAAGRARVLAVAEALPEERLLPVNDGEGEGKVHDPHVWGDVGLWAVAIGPVVELLSSLVPAEAEGFRERGEAYAAELAALDAWVRERVAEVPAGRRVLVTSHDAFAYFGEAYGVEVIGLQGVSTADEASLAGMAELVDLVKARGVGAIFVETSVNDAPIRRVATDAGVAIGGTLYSDSMGVPGEIEEAGDEAYDVGTYVGMMKHNVNAFVGALAGS